MIFENSSPKGIFGSNMSDSPNWSLTANSLPYRQPLLIFRGFVLYYIAQQGHLTDETYKTNYQSIDRFHTQCSSQMAPHVDKAVSATCWVVLES